MVFSNAPGLFKGQFRSAQGSWGEVERRGIEATKAPKGVGCDRVGLPTGEGRRKEMSPSGACAPSPQKFDLGSQYGEFWCILGGIFVAVQLPVLHTKSII